MNERDKWSDWNEALDHPGPEEIAAYHEGRLAPEDERRVQDHLVACRECAALLLDLESLADPDFGADMELPAGAGEAVWEAVHKEMNREKRKILPFRRKEAATRWLQPLAAVLLLSTLGLSAWVAVLQKKLSSPERNAPVLDLYPASNVRGERGEGSGLAVPKDARLFTVILNPTGRPAFAEYEVIVTKAGREVQRIGGLKPNPYGSFSLTFPRGFLGAGDFRLRLDGIGPGGSRSTVEEYALRVAGP